MDASDNETRNSCSANEIFHYNKIKSNLGDILYIWIKENSDVEYQDGMNDILAVSFLVLYPCYFKNSKK